MKICTLHKLYNTKLKKPIQYTLTIRFLNFLKTNVNDGGIIFKY